MIEVIVINGILQGEEPKFYYAKKIYENKIVFIVDKQEFENIINVINELDNE